MTLHYFAVCMEGYDEAIAGLLCAWRGGRPCRVEWWSVVVGCLDDDGAGRGCGQACAVGGDIINRVGGHLAGVDDDVGHELAVCDLVVNSPALGIRRPPLRGYTAVER
jgi:hypothetical protein